MKLKKFIIIGAILYPIIGGTFYLSQLNYSGFVFNCGRGQSAGIVNYLKNKNEPWARDIKKRCVRERPQLDEQEIIYAIFFSTLWLQLIGGKLLISLPYIIQSHIEQY